MREGDYEGGGDQGMGFRAKFDLERKTQLVFRKGEKGEGNGRVYGCKDAPVFRSKVAEIAGVELHGFYRYAKLLEKLPQWLTEGMIVYLLAFKSS